MGKLEELDRLLRKSEYEEDEMHDTALNESANALYQSFKQKFDEQQAPILNMKRKCNFAKEVICECLSNLYESALVIDDVDKYSDGLRDAMHEQAMDAMKDATYMKDLYALFENASPYVKAMLPLAEAAFENKDPEEVKEYDQKVILSKDDQDMIKKFEAEEGKDVYATTLQDRVIDVYKAEEALGEKQKERVQAVVDELQKVNNSEGDKTPMSESIEKGINLFSTTPKTIFNAIFINKSKGLMNETASSNLEDVSDRVIAETIATYTLLETIHALGVKTYSDEDKRKLRMEFFIGDN